MTDIRLHIDGDRYLDLVTWDMRIALKKGDLESELGKELCAIFMQDEAGNYLPREEALKILGTLNTLQTLQVIGELVGKFNTMAGDRAPLAGRTASPS